MTYNERLMALAQAREDQLQKIDLILTGKDISAKSEEVNLRLLTIECPTIWQMSGSGMFLNIA